MALRQEKESGEAGDKGRSKQIRSMIDESKKSGKQMEKEHRQANARTTAM